MTMQDTRLTCDGMGSGQEQARTPWQKPVLETLHMSETNNSGDIVNDTASPYTHAPVS